MNGVKSDGDGYRDFFFFGNFYYFAAGEGKPGP